MFTKQDSSRKSISRIVTVNPYTKNSYLLKSNKLSLQNKPTFNTSNFLASYLSNKDFISTKIGVSRSIRSEDIDSAIETKIYEELGLDQASEYVIDHSESSSEGEERLFNVFVAKPERLRELYGEIISDTKYIDLIFPAPLLYKILYERDILQRSRTDLFIYFMDNDATISVYKDGTFLYSKSLEFSLDKIHIMYCEAKGENVDKKEFINTLIKDGIYFKEQDSQQILMKIFSEVFVALNDVVIYSKRAFALDAVDNIFIGSVIGGISGLSQYSENYLGMASKDLMFEYDLDSNEWYTDQLEYLLALRALEFLKDDSLRPNLTIFPRPPSFAKRPSGQFTIAMAIGLGVALLYPGYYFLSSMISKTQTAIMESKDDDLKVEVENYKRILGEKKQQIEKLTKEEDRLRGIYNDKANTLNAIYNKKVNYKMRSEVFYNFSNYLNQFDVSVSSMENNESAFYISIVGKNDKKITELIDYIAKNRFEEIEDINIESITKDENSSYYNGVLKVELK
ncbi:MAG: hypothetical protein JXQ68_02290 [Campylobacterales bacterium]|nr:hypothetical protein [Campylobacterales bacterium]